MDRVSVAQHLFSLGETERGRQLRSLNLQEQAKLLQHSRDLRGRCARQVTLAKELNDIIKERVDLLVAVTEDCRRFLSPPRLFVVWCQDPATSSSRRSRSPRRR